MIESGKRTPSQETLELLATVFQREPARFLDESAGLEPPPPEAPGRGSPYSTRARIPVFQGRAPGGDSRAVGPDGHHGAPIRSPADPLAPGNVAQRLSGPRAGGG